MPSAEGLTDTPACALEEVLYCHEEMQAWSPREIVPVEDDDDFLENYEAMDDDVTFPYGFSDYYGGDYEDDEVTGESIDSPPPEDGSSDEPTENDLAVVPFIPTPQPTGLYGFIGFEPEADMAAWADWVLQTDPIEIFLKLYRAGFPRFGNRYLTYIPVDPVYAGNLLQIDTSTLELSMLPGRISRTEGLIAETFCKRSGRRLYCCMRCFASSKVKPFIDTTYDGIVRHICQEKACRSLRGCFFM